VVLGSSSSSATISPIHLAQKEIKLPLSFGLSLFLFSRSLGCLKSFSYFSSSIFGHCSRNPASLPVFVLTFFCWNRSPCVYILLFRPSEDSLQWSAIPDGSPSQAWQSTVNWRDCWIRTQDCSFTIWCCYQWATTAPSLPTWLPREPSDLSGFKPETSPPYVLGFLWMSFCHCSGAFQPPRPNHLRTIWSEWTQWWFCSILWVRFAMSS
jgi:hypothetical protein